ncbi:MAG TPA: hypothetical protein VNK04_04370 [Gemmataceae bacterium]|jgi:curli biogenesis system outer membrane secretion channel CsgG|nr:hypothetical protein [Gemmataceae bacterium]
MMRRLVVALAVCLYLVALPACNKTPTGPAPTEGEKAGKQAPAQRTINPPQ